MLLELKYCAPEAEYTLYLFIDDMQVPFYSLS